MPHKQKHRGRHPQDGVLFDAPARSILCQAVDDFVFLLDRGYSDLASLKLVGDRYQLKKRQRLAVGRVSCSGAQKKQRQLSRIAPDTIPQTVSIDGYNLLILVESALSGGIILKGRDGAYRDLASVHGSYQKVEETLPALNLIGKALKQLGVEEAVWFMDKPVSNSGKTAQIIRQSGIDNGWDWKTVVAYNPDKEVVESGAAVISSDSWVLDHCKGWVNLMAYLFLQGTMVNQPIVL